MANTLALSKIIEPFVRTWLKQKYKKDFLDQEFSLQLITGGKHKFDAVSLDHSIVADIKSSSVRINPKSSRKIGAGPIRSAIVDLYFLNLINAKKKILVLTDPDFFIYFTKKIKGKIASEIEVLYCELPPTIKGKIKDTFFNAQHEIGKK